MARQKIIDKLFKKAKRNINKLSYTDVMSTIEASDVG